MPCALDRMNVSSGECRKRLRAEIYAYEHDELVQAALQEFADFSSHDLSDGAFAEDLRAQWRNDLQAAKRELEGNGMLSRETLGPVRTFVLTRRIRGCARQST